MSGSYDSPIVLDSEDDSSVPVELTNSPLKVIRSPPYRFVLNKLYVLVYMLLEDWLSVSIFGGGV